MESYNFNERGEFNIWENLLLYNNKDSYSFFKFLFNLFSYPKWRITRLEYLVWVLILWMILFIFTSFWLNFLESISFFNTLLIILLFFSFIIISIKRFNDLNIGWYFSIILSLIPYINIILCVFLSWSNKENKYWKPIRQSNTVSVFYLKLKNIFVTTFDKILTVVVIWIIWVFIYMLYINWTTTSVDNPTNSTIFVKINAKWEEKEILPKSQLIFPIKSWNNEVFLNWKSVWTVNKDFFSYPSNFINPTLSTYVSEYILYVDKEILAQWYNGKYDDKLPVNKINVLDSEIIWPFKKYEWLHIKWSWSYWDVGNITKKDEIESVSKEYDIQEKLYRLDDFIEMYNKNYVEENSL